MIATAMDDEGGDRGERLLKMIELMRSLDRPSHKLLQLITMESRSLAEAAEIMGISVWQAEQRLRAVKAKIRGYL